MTRRQQIAILHSRLEQLAAQGKRARRAEDAGWARVNYLACEVELNALRNQRAAEVECVALRLFTAWAEKGFRTNDLVYTHQLPVSLAESVGLHYERIVITGNGDDTPTLPNVNSAWGQCMAAAERLVP